MAPTDHGLSHAWKHHAPAHHRCVPAHHRCRWENLAVKWYSRLFRRFFTLLASLVVLAVSTGALVYASIKSREASVETVDACTVGTVITKVRRCSHWRCPVPVVMEMVLAA